MATMLISLGYIISMTHMTHQSYSGRSFTHARVTYG